jgi:glyoxylase-like metal-dependent hydrolase (beta-lactamase superfamily II)
MTADVYKVYAIRYGHFEQRSPANYIGGDAHDVAEPLDYYVWAIVGDKRTVIVDTGFDERRGKLRNRTIVRPVQAGLAAAGIDPGSVSDVIITHLHYDHAGNHDLFPNAKYHLQECEMNYATGRCMCHAQLRLPFEPEDVSAIVHKLFAGRVMFHDGSSVVQPGINVHKIGGHSKGLQCVSVETRRGRLLLASDAAHFYRHLSQGKVFPVLYSYAEVIEGYRTLRTLAESDDHIIPGHDPLVLQKYAAENPALDDWVVRVDGDPRPIAS